MNDSTIVVKLMLLFVSLLVLTTFGLCALWYSTAEYSTVEQSTIHYLQNPPGHLERQQGSVAMWLLSPGGGGRPGGPAP